MEWNVCEDGHWYTTIQAETVDDALDEARNGVDEDVYREPHDIYRTTHYVDVRVQCEETGEEASDTVVVEPLEPPCSADEHYWDVPFRVLVWGHGGGVVSSTVCRHCGWYRRVDTWAQRRDTGEQGLTETAYLEPDERSLAWIQKLTAARE